MEKLLVIFEWLQLELGGMHKSGGFICLASFALKKLAREGYLKKKNNTSKATATLKQILLDQRFSSGLFLPSTRTYQSFDASAQAVSMSNL